jgi:bifunctional non-homologous end joining protein LigD
MEGAVFKRVSSLYLPGQRIRSWRKVLFRTISSAVVVGWVPGGGAERNMVGALVLGAYDDAVLRYVGHVGTGFNMAVRRQLKEKLTLLERRTSPLGTESEVAAAAEHGMVRWVEPVIVVDVAYREYLRGGIRHPSFKGQRGDLDPGSITRDAL